MWLPDRLALELLAPLAVWVFASGLDDLVIDLSWFWLLLWLWSLFAGTPWAVGAAISQRPWLAMLLAGNAGLVLWRLAVRTGFGWTIYGWRHAACAGPYALGERDQLLRLLHGVASVLARQVRQETIAVGENGALVP